MKSLIHVDRYFEYCDEENPHTSRSSKIDILQQVKRDTLKYHSSCVKVTLKYHSPGIRDIK
jgi:hypothetical protein